MICPRCQTPVSEESKFCPQCGGVIPLSPPKEASPQKFFTGKKKFVVIGFVLLIFIIAGLWFFLSRQSSVPLAQMKKTVSPTERSEVVLEKAKVAIPQGAVSQETEITVKKYSAEKAPPPPQDSHLASEVYEFGPAGLIFSPDQPAVVTLPYDPANLSAEEIETLCIAYLKDGEWVPLEGSMVDTSQRTVSAPAPHFSLMGVLNKIGSAIKAVGEAAFQDVIEAKTSFSQLPPDLQETLQAEYSPQAIKGAVFWKVSQASKGASTTLAVANVVDQLSGLALSALEGGEEALEYALAEMVALTLGEEIISEAAGEEVGTISVALYETGKLGAAIAEKGFKAIRGTATLQAEIAQWILAEEMKYINANVGEGFQTLWQLNIVSPRRVQVYLVTIDGANNQTGLHDRGIKYYYYDTGSERFTSYYDDLVSRKIEVEISQKPAPSPTAPTPTPTSPAPSAGVSEERESSRGSIAAFAADWSWSKERNQDGKYGETKVSLDLGGKTVESATLYVTAGYSQQAGGAAGTVYISSRRQVPPTDGAHDKGGYWYGNSLAVGTSVGNFSCTYTASTSNFDVTNFLKNNSAVGTFYVAVENKDAADIGISSIYIKATVR